ncbi:4775_t:CDS:2, partial [Racocetra fulgida]
EIHDTNKYIEEDTSLETPLTEDEKINIKYIEEDTSLETPLTEDEKINIKYCQEKICRFLFPYQQPEQETRANLHTRAYTQLARSLNHIRFITQEKFLNWTKERKIRPIAQHSRMINDRVNITNREKKIMGVEDGVKLEKSYCIDQFKLNITTLDELGKEVMFKLVTDTLKAPPMTEEYENLIKTVKKIQNQYGIKNVYLAADFPLNSGRAQSDSFRKLSNFHKEAIKILGLNNSFVNSSDHIKFNTWISMDGLSQIRKDPKYAKEFKGPGIQGILD